MFMLKEPLEEKAEGKWKKFESNKPFVFDVIGWLYSLCIGILGLVLGLLIALVIGGLELLGLTVIGLGIFIIPLFILSIGTSIYIKGEEQAQGGNWYWQLLDD